MSLIDDLRGVMDNVPPSHVPTVHELTKVVGALILHLELGDKLFETAGAEDGHQAVVDLLDPPEPEPEDAPQAAPEPSPAPSPSYAGSE